ncbi:MAG: hypothetical protein NC084_10410 [Bacteroides sp.]|nr:potassium transporter Trk [Eubacterium sp.]MCM1418994.1 potassium transporter Trk [Roseburia sp.]MCM1463112.1 hypothetical protein [Bacteroides sp.]
MPILSHKKEKELSPARTLAIGFLAIILIGALLLCLPFSSKSGRFTDFTDCLFTAASATCVTGIAVFETYLHWSIFGQVVIMLLIQVGGLGFVTLVTFFNLAIGRKLGLTKAMSASGELTLTGLSATKRIFTRVVVLSLSVELVGALLLMPRLIPRYGGYGAFMAVFTAVSSFCNAGFDLFGIEGEGAGLTLFADDPYILLVLSALILIGGLGFVVWEEIIAYPREKRFSLHSRIVFAMTVLLVIAGTAVYLVIELTEEGLFGEYPFGQKLLTSFFASVSARTAGFTAAPLATANSFAEMFTIVLMLIGAAPGSTGGGIKITTVAIVIATAWSVLRGREETRILRHMVEKRVVYKTITVLFLSFLFISLGFIVLVLLNHEANPLDVLFEIASAFSTAGFSTGLSASAGTATKLLISFVMYVGRIGPVSLMLSFTGRQSADRSEILPKGEIMVG